MNLNSFKRNVEKVYEKRLEFDLTSFKTTVQLSWPCVWAEYYYQLDKGKFCFKNLRDTIVRLFFYPHNYNSNLRKIDKYSTLGTGKICKSYSPSAYLKRSLCSSIKCTGRLSQNKVNYCK